MKRYTTLSAAAALLTALAPAVSRAAENTWNNGSTDFLWNATSLNWTSPTAWVDGDGAIFDATGVGTVNLGVSVAAGRLTFNTPGYSIYSGTDGIKLTLNGATPSITNNGAGTQIATEITGTNGLEYRGTGDLILRGNTTGGSGPTAGSGNTYSGETYVRSGTLILSVTNRASAVNGNNLLNHGTEWAASAIGGVDEGATLKLGNFYAGSQVNYQVPRGQIQENTHVIMNGGTFDGNGEDNLQSYPAFSGFGRIINSSAVARSVIKMANPAGASGQTVTNACEIGDPSPMVPSPISGKRGHEIDLDLGGNSTTWLFTGANSNLNGSWRLGGSQTAKFTKDGGMGIPNYLVTPNTVRMNGAIPAPILDLNGTAQFTGGFAGNGNSTGNAGQPNAFVCNNNPGTLSILTIGVANLGLNALAPTNVFVAQWGSNITVTPGGGNTVGYAFVDNSTGTGGRLGVTKVGTNIAQFTGTWNISGPLVVNNGFLNLVPGAGTGLTPVLKGPVVLYSNGNIPGSVTNSYLGLFTIAQNSVIPVPALYIDGVRQTNGLYGSIGNTAGARQVSVISNGSTPNGDVLQVWGNLNYAQAGNSLTLSWDGTIQKLQSQTNSITGTWYDYPGGTTSPVITTIDPANQDVFYRLQLQ